MVLEIFPIKISKEIEQGDNIAGLILASKFEIKDNDIVVIAQKVISKQEGRVVNLLAVIPSLLAVGLASEYGKDPRLVEAILSESKRIVRMENGIIIVETHHGFVCANAGVDESNVQEGYATLLPSDPAKSAELIQNQIQEKTGKKIAVLISDTFGRPFRTGQTNYAIGVSGLKPIMHYQGTKDTFGKTLRVTETAIADEICSAAELCMGNTLHTPVAVVRNYHFEQNVGTVQEMLRPKDQDLFR